jgi:hypothetical protein
MLTLKRLTITKFRHVEPTELVFDDRYTVPLGINGSGKTTLLNLVSACLQSNFSAYKAERFDIEYELAAESFAATIHITNGPEVSPTPNGIPQARLKQGTPRPTSQGMTSSAALVSISFSGKIIFQAELRQGQLLAAVSEGPKHIVSSPSTAPIDGDFLQPILLNSWDHLPKTPESPERFEIIWRHLGLLPFTSASARFDESLDLLNYFAGAQRSGAFSEALVKLFFTEQGEAGPSSLERRFVPPVILPIILRDAKSSSLESGALTLDLSDLDPFTFFVKATAFQSIRLQFKVLKAEPVVNGKVFDLGDLTFRLRTRDGTDIIHDALSYGQKRLLSFLYYVACNDAFIIADELVNGLHHAWIEVCLDAIGERQAFLTSQNPILLDFLPPASPEEAERRFIRCVPEEREGRDVMVWRNLTPDEAKELCANYAAGVQQLSDLLRIQGLW